jgi:hypothetical protein
MMWAVVLLYDVLERRAGWRGAAGAGVLFGAAATLRTEALVDLAVAIAVTCLVMLWRDRSLGRPLRTGSLVLLGALLPLLANTALERFLAGGDLRGARAAGTAAASGSAASNRVQEALTSGIGIGMGNFRPSADWAVGALVACLVGGGALALTRGDRRRQLLGAIAVGVALLVYLMRFRSGLGFVPGLFVASPLAAAGLFVCWREPRARVVGAIACAALPVVWAVQYTGNSWPQWGARYILTSGVLLAVCAGAVLQRSPRAFVATCVVAGCVTAGGLVWIAERTHTNADAMVTIVARHDELLISRREQFFREVGAYYSPSQRWLTATTDSQLREAVRIADESGARELATIGLAGQDIPGRIGRYVRGRTQFVPFTRSDIHLQVTTYRRSA